MYYDEFESAPAPIGAEIQYAIGVIADTHGKLPGVVFDLFAGVDLILHAGDVGRDELLIELETLAPVKAVSGNVDGTPHPSRRPLEQRLETPAGHIAMVHGHLPEVSSTSCDSLLRHFTDFRPNIIIFGHSHKPYLQEIDGVWLLNPGSAGSPRFGMGPSVAMIKLYEASPTPRLELIPLSAHADLVS